MTTETRSALRSLRRGDLDSTLIPVLDHVIHGVPTAHRERAEVGLAAFCAWVDRLGIEFADLDEAFTRYQRAVAGTNADNTLPFVQLFLVALGDRKSTDRHIPAHSKPKLRIVSAA